MAKNESQTPAQPEPPEDDVRARFRAALERKKGGSAAGSAGAEGGPKASGATSNTKVQREFRRKSGG